MNGKQLKNSILQWAIQGKLVPQDPNDEPASVLLEKIRQEKERLIKEKKIKRDKNASIIFRGEDNSYYENVLATGEVKCIDEEIPFEVPSSWCWTRIKDLGITETGTTPSKSHPEYFGNLIPFYGPGNIQDNKIVSCTQGISKEGIPYCRQVAANTILQVCIGGSIGKAAITEKVSAFNQQINSLSVFEVLNVEYIFTVLITDLFRQQILDKATGTATPIINRGNWETLLVSLPPIAEQQRIVNKLHELEPAIERYGNSEEALGKLNASINDLLKKSILQEAIQGKLVPQTESEGTAAELLQQIKQEKQRLVKEGKLKKSALSDSVIYKGDDNRYYEQIGNKINEVTEEIRFDLPNKWQWCRIGVIFMHNNGKQLNKGTSKGELRKYITTSNLYWDGFTLDNLKMMPFEEKEIERCMAVKGDLLVCEGGDIGRACIWNSDSPIMLQNHIHKLRPYVSVCTKYFYYIFYLYNLTGLIGGKGIGIQGFSSKALHNTLVPLPPLKEQQRIVAQIEKLFEQLR